MQSLSLVMSECFLTWRDQGHVSNFYAVDLENFATASRRYTGVIHNSTVVGLFIWSLWVHPLRSYKRRCKMQKMGWFGAVRRHTRSRIFPEAPPWKDLHQMWLSCIGRRRNQLWQIFGDRLISIWSRRTQRNAGFNECLVVWILWG